jgi:hypothetical protein
MSLVGAAAVACHMCCCCSALWVWLPCVGDRQQTLLLSCSRQAAGSAAKYPAGTCGSSDEILCRALLCCIFAGRWSAPGGVPARSPGPVRQAACCCTVCTLLERALQSVAQLPVNLLAFVIQATTILLAFTRSSTSPPPPPPPPPAHRGRKLLPLLCRVLAGRWSVPEGVAAGSPG